jgi:serine/threonine protein kinase
MPLQPGDKLGPYEILSPIGKGGMGTVYRGHDSRLSRDVAIKISSSQSSERFGREAKAIAALNHPNICQVYDVGPNYLVMELIEGSPLLSKERPGPLPLDEALRYAVQIADAVSAAHAKGITHRDLKPGNIMVTRDNAIKLLDFGLAKQENPDQSVDSFSTVALSLTEPGMVLGTVAYMSPEQAQGLAVDARSDIFSFGLVLYEMLSGRRAFTGGSPLAVAAAILHKDAGPLDAPPAAQDILARCLRKSPDDRIQSMTQVKETLLAIARAAGSPAERRASIAVLPFANMSRDPDDEYFSDGLAEEILNLLAKISGLQVISRTSSFAFKGQNTDIRRIAEALGVRNILEGSVRRAGSRIRVTAQLINAADGYHLWSERYDSELTDVFAVQDNIAAAIAGMLRAKLSPEAAAPHRYVPNLRAYEAYLKARDLWFKGTRPESLAVFKGFLERAIELDPKFALAYSFLGMYYTMQANLGLKSAREVIPWAVAAEEQALRVDSSLPEAQALLAVCIGAFDYDWNKAEQHWRLAMAREPVSCDVLFWYGNHHLLPVGRTDDAIDAMKRGLEGDPLNLLYRHHYARGLRFAGRLEDAEAELRSILEVDDNYPHALATLGSICAQQQRYDEALVLTEKAHALMPWSSLTAGQLAAILLRTGGVSRAATLIENLKAGEPPGGMAGLSVFHALCGEIDQAAEWTERAVEHRDMSLIQNLGPFLRPTSHWPALAKLMNLPATN